MHLNEAQVELYLYDELPPGERALVDQHVAECASCRNRLSEARATDAFVHRRLQSLDRESGALALSDVVAAAARPRYALRYAAGIALVAVSAATAYAWPGSPIRDWLRNRFDTRAPAGQIAPATPTQSPDAETVGVALDVGERFAIEFASAQISGVLQITVTEASQLVLRTAGRSVTFSSDVNLLRVRNEGSAADYVIQLPRSLAHADIRVAGRAVFRKAGPATMPALDPTGRLTLPVK